MSNKARNIVLDKRLYPLEAILNASFLFISRFYIHLQKGKSAHTIIVSLTPQKKLSSKKFAGACNEFLNSLLYAALRYLVSKRSKKVRDYIVSRAVYSALPLSDFSETREEGLDYKKDPLKIAVPWEEKYGAQKKNK